jgi:hypothetical protein
MDIVFGHSAGSALTLLAVLFPRNQRALAALTAKALNIHGLREPINTYLIEGAINIINHMLKMCSLLQNCFLTRADEPKNSMCREARKVPSIHHNRIFNTLVGLNPSIMGIICQILG